MTRMLSFVIIPLLFTVLVAGKFTITCPEYNNGILHDLKIVYEGNGNDATIGITFQSGNCRNSESEVIDNNYRRYTKRYSITIPQRCFHWSDNDTITATVEKMLNPILETGSEEIFQINCKYSRMQEFNVAGLIEKKIKVVKSITQVLSSSRKANEQIVSYFEDANGKPVTEVFLGSPIRLVITTQNSVNKNGFYIDKIVAKSDNNSDGEIITLIKSGCAVERQSVHLTFDPDRTNSVRKFSNYFKAFRFTGKKDVWFSVRVYFCYNANRKKCSQVSNCYERRRRSLDVTGSFENTEAKYSIISSGKEENHSEFSEFLGNKVTFKLFSKYKAIIASLSVFLVIACAVTVVLLIKRWK